MEDLIFNNIFILIPIALFIALRIIGARKKQQEKTAKEPVKEKPHLLFFEEDYVDDDEPPAPSFIPERPRAFTPKKETTRVIEGDILELTSAPVKKPAPVKKSTASFPKNLDYLPPLKRALVLSEILGPPKGM